VSREEEDGGGRRGTGGGDGKINYHKGKNILHNKERFIALIEKKNVSKDDFLAVTHPLFAPGAFSYEIRRAFLLVSLYYP